MKDSPRHFWGISANGNTLRLHRRVESSILSSSTIFVVCKPYGISMRVTPLGWRVLVVITRKLCLTYMSHVTAPKENFSSRLLKLRRSK